MPRTKFNNISFSSLVRIISHATNRPPNFNFHLPAGIALSENFTPGEKYVFMVLIFLDQSPYQITMKQLSEVLGMDRGLVARTRRKKKLYDQTMHQLWVVDLSPLRIDNNHILININNNNKKSIPVPPQPKKKKSAGANKKYIFEQRHLNLAKKFLKLQKKNHPNRIKLTDTNYQKAAHTIRQLEDIDGFEFKKEIKPALLFAIKDDFWSGVVFTPATVRKKASNGVLKFYNLLMSYTRTQSRNGSPPEIDMPDNHKEIIKYVKTFLSEAPDQAHINFLAGALLKLESFWEGLPDIDHVWMLFPTFKIFIQKYVEFMDDLSWLDDIKVNIFRTDHQVFKMFLRETGENLNINLITGKYINI